MKPVILATEPIFTDALIRSTDMMFPEHEDILILYPDGYKVKGFDKVYDNNDKIEAYVPIDDSLRAVQLAASYDNTFMLLRDTCLFTRPFNVVNNPSYDKLKFNPTIFSYELSIDNNLPNHPDKNIYFYKNCESVFCNPYLDYAAIYNSKTIIDMLDGITNFDEYMSKVCETTIVTNRIYDDRRYVVVYNQSKVDVNELHEHFMKGMVIDITPFLYLETNEFIFNPEVIPLIWRK